MYCFSKIIQQLLYRKEADAYAAANRVKFLQQNFKECEG